MENKVESIGWVMKNAKPIFWTIREENVGICGLNLRAFTMIAPKLWDEHQRSPNWHQNEERRREKPKKKGRDAERPSFARNGRMSKL